MILDEAAERLFGQGASKPATQSVTQTSADEIAERMFGATAPKPETPTANDPAARVFGGPAAEQAPEEARQPRTDAEMQAILYPKPEAPGVDLDIPDAILAERQADKDRAMFSPKETFREVLPDTMWDEDPEAENIPEHVRVAVIGEMREMAADLGMDTADVKTLRDLGATFKAEPSEDQIIAWREEAVDHLNRTFGNQATQALRDAQALYVFKLTQHIQTRC